MPRQSADLILADVPFSRSELKGVLKTIPPKTKEVEKLGAALARKPTPAKSYKFSKAVCREWAPRTGRRVWGKLKIYHNPDDLGKQLRSWFQNITPDIGAAEAIKPGVAIKGLGVSFASKHLRLLCPQKFAVLDSVLSQKLGFPLTIKGYEHFMQTLHDFRRCYRLRAYNVGTLEMGIFWLIQDQKKKGRSVR